MLWGNCCLYRSIICDASMERVALKVLSVFFFVFIFISWKLKLELLIFFLGKLCNSFMHASKTTNFTWHELICLIGGYINTHITGTSLTLNMQTSTFIFPEISANEELPSAWRNVVLLQIRDDTGIGLKSQFLKIYSYLSNCPDIFPEHRFLISALET